MRELEEDQNRAGYAEELEERLALAGCRTARDAMIRRVSRAQSEDPDEEDLDEDELEEEELVDQVVELEHALVVAAAIQSSRRPTRAGGKE